MSMKAKSIKFVVAVLMSTVTGQSVFTQYYVKFKSDSLEFVKDSVILSVQTEAAIIEWQVSKDSVTWYSLDETNDTLLIRIDSCAFYRAVITDGTCYPLKSDVAKVAFQSSDVLGNAFTIDPAGGVYIMPSGIKIIVPPGSVSEPASLSMDLLNKSQADNKLPFNIFAGREFCAAMYCNPAGIRFQKPVRLVIPALNYKYTDLPCIYIYNPDSGSWDQHFGTLLCSEEMHSIEFSIETLYPVRVELIHTAFKKTGYFEEKGYAEDRICQRGLVEIVSSSHDYMGAFANGSCTATTNSVQATFLNCKDQPVSKDLIQEISDKCLPTCTVSLSKNCFYTVGSQITMNFEMQVGGLPLAFNMIVVEMPSGIAGVDGCSTCAFPTDSEGKASLIIKSTEPNAKGIINWSAAAEYYLRVQALSGPAGTETNKEFLKTVELSGTKEIIACPKIRLSFKSNRSLPDYPYKVQQKENYIFTPVCYDQNNNVIPCPGEVEFFVDETTPAGKQVVEIDPKTNTLTTTSGGIAAIRARIKNSDIVSGSQVFNVAFQGILNISVTDWDNHRCYCNYNPDPYVYDWFLMSYYGSFDIKLWLNMTPDVENNMASFRIEQEVAYRSTSQYCKDTTWADPEVYYTELTEGMPWYWTPNVRAFTVADHVICTTKMLLDGTEFVLTFREFLHYISEFICKYNSSGDIEIKAEYFIPDRGGQAETCVGQMRSVIPAGVLH